MAASPKAVARQPAEIVATVIESGLRGRGRAGFPTGIKWKTTLEPKAEQKYIVCNADEGDSGTLADRMIIEGDLFSKKAPPGLRALTDRKAREARSHLAK
jgi:formate dehydrogenase iron-sulfur subunit